MHTNKSKPDQICLYLLGQTKIIYRQKTIATQPKPFLLLAYLGLNWRQAHRREALQALFWPDKTPHAAANNLRQALWHLRQSLPNDIFLLQDDSVRWNDQHLPWIDALAFEKALDEGDLDSALEIYAGLLIPNAYDEWIILEQERLHLRYLNALEQRAQQRYEAHNPATALSDAEKLIASDPLNETATRLAMACHWALGQREAARRDYAAYCQRLTDELQTSPLPETTNLFHHILRGEPHPFRAGQPTDALVAAKTSRLSLLETLGAFNQGLEQAKTWAQEAEGAVLAEALRWQGCFCLRLGKMDEAVSALEMALPLAERPDLQAAILTNLAATKTGIGDFAAAEAIYAEATQLSPLAPETQARLLSSLGGLQGRAGRLPEAKRTLQEAVGLSRQLADPALLAMAGGNLGILLVNQGEMETAVTILQEALAAAQKSDAHWLTAHISGHLGVIAEGKQDWETAIAHYQRARTLAETFNDQRGAVLWGLNLGVALYEQGRPDKALPLLEEGRKQAVTQGIRALEAGASIYMGACLVAEGRAAAGLTHIEEGLTIAKEVGDQERILTGLLHQGRALAALGQPENARISLQTGLDLVKSRSRTHRLENYLQKELAKLPPPA